MSFQAVENGIFVSLSCTFFLTYLSALSLYVVVFPFAQLTLILKKQLGGETWNACVLGTGFWVGF